MLTPCPHCNQQVTPTDGGVCPLCSGRIRLPSAAAVTDTDAVLFEGDVAAETEFTQPEATQAEVVEPRVASEASIPALAWRPGPGLLVSVAIMFGIWGVQFAALLAAFLVAVALGLIDVETMRSGSDQQKQEHIQQFMQEDGMAFLLPFGPGSVLLVALIAMAFLRHDLKTKLGLRPFTSFQFLLVVMAAAPASLLAAQAVGLIARLLGEWVTPDIPGTTMAWPIPAWGLADIHVMAISWPILFISISILPGISEEIIFRGVIGRGLIARYGAVSGIILTSLLFGITHLYPGQVVFAFFLGLLLHFIYLSTRSLLAPILFHMLVNATFLLAVGLKEQIPIPGYNRPEMNQMTPWPLLAVCAALLGTIIWAMRSTRTRFVLDDGTSPQPHYDTIEPPPPEWGPRAQSKDAHGLLVILLLALFCAFVVALSRVGSTTG